ncbi:MAG: hypothetical protein NC084_12915 [Bacteroides sp.]|nr:hypothetical protein [Eubacterium sp.]MCM1419575.1 hypothetical protein [Roseburia sp.]MCM1463596.1 hypothetical protein [Bacteroides sp.]
MEENKTTATEQEADGKSAQGETTAPPTPPSGEKQTEKTFTQAELDSAIEARLARERKNQPTKEELKAFREWKDSQKTEEEKTAERIRLAREAQGAAEQRAAELEAKYTALTKGVKAEAVDDVIALARGKVSETVTIEQAIDGVIAKYPSFTAADKPLTTGVPTSNDRLGGENDELLKKAMGL